MTAPPHRWLTLALAPLVAAVALAVPAAAPARAEPGSGTSTTADDGADNPLLNDVLDSTGRRYVAAKAAVDKSTQAQVQLQRAISLAEINALNDQKLHQLNQAIAEVSAAKARLDQEVASQKQSLAVMAKQKQAAEDALTLIGGDSLTQGDVVATSPQAAPAPRNADGGFSPEPCTVPDPTTDGCITARTLHMYQEVKKAGFNRFVGCHRNGGPFEHPKGRACDWSLQKSGFSVAHNRDMKDYGNNLMAFLVRNADRLGVLYVIWFKQIYFPGVGWHAYHGDSEHTDHVHVSIL